jgi:cysteine desulfuration protein SufE
MNIQELQQSIVKEFSQFENWENKYSHLIEIGKNCHIDDKYKTDQYKVKGCQSSVWMFAEIKDGKIYFYADSDAAIVRGLVALLLKVYSGRTPEEVIHTPPDFLEELGLKTHLSQTRASGLASMIKQMRLYAFALSIKSQNKS